MLGTERTHSALPASREKYSVVSGTSSKCHDRRSDPSRSPDDAPTDTNRVRPTLSSRVFGLVWARERFDAPLRAELPRECGAPVRR